MCPTGRVSECRFILCCCIYFVELIARDTLKEDRLRRARVFGNESLAVLTLEGQLVFLSVGFGAFRI
jgi:hypothetical protein